MNVCPFILPSCPSRTLGEDDLQIVIVEISTFAESLSVILWDLRQPMEEDEGVRVLALLGIDLHSIVGICCRPELVAYIGDILLFIVFGLAHEFLVFPFIVSVLLNKEIPWPKLGVYFRIFISDEIKLLSLKVIFR